jgi:hypothetical protein
VANNCSSDGSTPQKQTEQILAVTPILRGQAHTEKNPIPPPQHRSSSYASTKSPITSHAPQPPTGDNDLIDFGQNDEAPDLPANLHPTQAVKENPKHQKLEQTLLETSTEQKPQGSPLINFHDDLKRDLPAGNSLTRHDTETSDMDEFVDAEG